MDLGLFTCTVFTSVLFYVQICCCYNHDSYAAFLYVAAVYIEFLCLFYIYVHAAWFFNSYELIKLLFIFRDNPILAGMLPKFFFKLFSFMFWFGISEICFTLLYPNHYMNAMADLLTLFDFLVHKPHLWFTDSNFCFLYFYSNQHHPVFLVRLWVLLYLPVNPCYTEFFFYATYFNPHFTNSLILIY